jgi:hypothetical protein
MNEQPRVIELPEKDIPYIWTISYFTDLSLEGHTLTMRSGAAFPLHRTNYHDRRHLQ